LYKYYPNKDAILADLSIKFMQQDAELFSRIFAESARKRQRRAPLIDALVEALMSVHREDSQVRGVVYQNLERVKLLGHAQSATQRIQTQGMAAVPELDPVQAWVAISAINAAVHSTSQVPRELQQWDFVKALVQNILAELLSLGGTLGRNQTIRRMPRHT
jgi:AcrR family transcriptional regulator